MDPATMAAIANTIIQAYSAYKGGKATAKDKQRAKDPRLQFEERKNRLIDELLASVSGDGKYSDLFKTDEAAFEKSFVNPAKKMFETKVAPQIQQSAIAGGSQYGTGMQDELTRAGVDLDSMLNAAYLDFQERGTARKASTIGNILGTAAPEVLDPGTNPLEALLGSVAGFFGSEAFGKGMGDIFGSSKKTPTTPTTPTRPERTSPTLNRDPMFDNRPGFATP